MSEPDKKKWCSVKANNEFFSIKTYSGYWNCLPDPEGKDIFLSPSEPDKEIGGAILEAISASRTIDPSEHPDFFNARGRVVPQYNEWVQNTMDKYAYKTKRAMFKDMKSCLIEQANTIITIRPSHHEKLEAWSAGKITENDYVIIPVGSSSAEVGAALRLALSRCT